MTERSVFWRSVETAFPVQLGSSHAKLRRDLIVVAACWLLGFLLRFNDTPEGLPLLVLQRSGLGVPVLLLPLIVGIYGVAFRAAALGGGGPSGSCRDVWLPVVRGSAGAGLVVLLVVRTAFPGWGVSAGTIIRFWFLALVGVGLMRTPHLRINGATLAAAVTDTARFARALIASVRPDLVLVAVSWLAAYVVRFWVLGRAQAAVGRPRFAVYVLVLPAILLIWTGLSRLCNVQPGRTAWRVWARWIDVTKASTAASASVFVLLEALAVRYRYSRAVVVLFWPLAALSVGLWQTVFASSREARPGVLRWRRVRVALQSRASTFGEALIVIACGWVGAYLLRFYVVGPPLVTGEVPGAARYVLFLPLILVFWLAALWMFFPERAGQARGTHREWLAVAKATTVAGAAIYGVSRVALAHGHYSRTVIAYSLILSFVGVGLWRARDGRRPVISFDDRADGPRRAFGSHRWLVSILSSRLVPSNRREMLLAGLAAALLVAHYGYVAVRTGFLPCSLDCGETYESHIGALNLYRFGLGYGGGLQDFAADERPEAHPTLYTHNPNIGMYFMYLLFRLGYSDVHAQAALASIPFGIGLFYMYLFIRLVSRSGFVAALSLMTAALSYPLVVHWGFQPLRAFSWLLTFGPAYHLCRYSPGPGNPKRHLVAGMGLLGMSFGIDYPFALFAFLSIVGLRLVRVVQIPWRSVATILALAFGVPFVLRQIQVAAVVGPSFWVLDVGYSLLRRIAPARFLAQIPEESSLRELYVDRHVLKWPDPATFDPADWTRKIWSAYTEVLGPAFGVVLLVFVAVAIWLRSEDVRAIEARGGGGVLAVGRVVLALFGAQALTFVVFGSYLAIFYGVVMGPLFVHWIVPLLGLATYVLVSNARSAARIGRVSVPVGALLLGLFIMLRMGTEIRNFHALRPLPYPGRTALKELKGEPVLTFWISSPVATYTGQWAAVLADPRVLDGRRLDFDPDRDYYFFFEADRSNPAYRRPKFLFIPGVNVGWLHNSSCEPFQGHVGTYVDGCPDLDAVAKRFGWLPLYTKGDQYLIYDLRGLDRRF